MRDTSEKTVFYIVRHGETKFNKEGIVQGVTDSHLTGEGVQQAKFLGEKFANIRFDAVFASDLSRTQRTARLIAPEHKDAINTSALLRERNFGKWDGGPASIWRKENKHIFEKMKTLEATERRVFKIAPDVESDAEVHDRFSTFLRNASEAHKGKTLLVVSHGGTMRVFLGHLLGNDLPSGSVKNTAYMKITSNGLNFLLEESEGIANI